MTSQIKTALLLSLLTLFLVLMGGAMGGRAGLGVALVLAGALGKLDAAAREIPMRANPDTVLEFSP